MKNTRISSIVMGAALTASVLVMPFAAFAKENGKGHGQSKGLVHIELNGKVNGSDKHTESQEQNEDRKIKRDDKITPGDFRNGKLDEKKVQNWIAFLQSWLVNYRAHASSTPPVNHQRPPHATTTPPVGPNASTTPVISNITASFGSGSIRVAWNSSSLSDSTVFYSTSSPVVIGATSTQVSVNSAMTTRHAINITGLATSTPYYFIIQSKNQVGTTTSGQFSLTTLNI